VLYDGEVCLGGGIISAGVSADRVDRAEPVEQ
jgi:hypothetical protein